MLPCICLWAKPKVVTTTTILYDLTRNLAGDKCDVLCLMPVGGDPHIYEPTPADAQKVADGDLIIKNGLHLEGWLNKLIISANPQAVTVEAAEGIEPIKSATLHGSPDPHAWMDPNLVKTYVQNITRALVQLDFENKSFYESNSKAYILQLQTLDTYIKTQVAKIPQKQRVLITSHDAFKYFGRQYGIKVESAMGTSTDAEVQIGDLNHLVQIIKEKGIPAIFVETTINPKLLTQVAKDNGIFIGGSLYSDSIGDEDSPGGTYIGMLRYNIDTITKALTMPPPKSPDPNNDFLVLIISVSVLLSLSFLYLYLNIKTSSKAEIDWSEFHIEISDVSTSYDRKTVLSNINLSLHNGRLYGLLGPNGAGKSTLFKSVLGLIKPDRGSITINGVDIKNFKDKIAYIPQKEDIDWSFPATVVDIVLMGRLPYLSRMRGYSAGDYKMADDALERVGMLTYRNRQIKDLSGGQQQRVFIARALCEDAKILMFDEPFVGVDVLTEESIIQLIRELVKTNKTVIIIHHDLSKVEEYFDEVIMINQRLVACGPTKDTFNAKNISNTFGGRLTILQERDKHVL